MAFLSNKSKYLGKIRLSPHFYFNFFLQFVRNIFLKIYILYFKRCLKRPIVAHSGGGAYHYKYFISYKKKQNKMKYLLQQRCRTTRSCIIGPYHQGCGPDSIEKDSRSARRADRSRQRQARLHTVGFGLAEGQPTCGVGRRPSLRALYPSHES